MNQQSAAADRLAEAHRELTADASVQFELRGVTPPEPPPQWLLEAFRAMGRFFDWLGAMLPDAPYARILLWSLLAVAAGFLLWSVVERLRHGAWRLPRRRPVAAAEPEAELWMPDAAPVRAWLAEADALAAQGRYAEAAHHLLFRSVEDIAQRRPQLNRPSFTSRELAAAEALPPAARRLFSRIALLVERSLFGGRAVDAADWSAARAAYADFALPAAWRA